mgnify:CR=1 FL=1
MPKGQFSENLLPSWLFQRVEKRMRTADRFLKTVVFVGVVDNGVFEPLGTGFLVRKDYPADVGYQYIVTATHVIAEETRPISIRVNRHNDEPDYLKLPFGWFYHPDDSRFVDVAVAPIVIDPTIYDVAAVLMKQFCTRQVLQDRDIGIGDEIFFPGLFLPHSGDGRNLPVLRSGTIAGMPIEPVKTRDGPILAYLMEGRSIGGHSGSPVFLNFLQRRIFHSERGLKLPLHSEDMPYLFMGLIRGCLRAKDSGEYIASNSKEDNLWVNFGISTIIPSWDIFETIEQDDLEKQRMDHLKLYRAASADVPASASHEKKSDPLANGENPTHREDFTRLVGAAARKPAPKG